MEEIKWTIPFTSSTKEEVLESKIIIPFEKKVVVLHLPNFDADISFEDFFKIDYSNIIGELLTFSVIMNRVGILRAEMEEIAKNKKFEADVYEAQLKKHYRSMLFSKSADGTKKKATNPEIDEAVLIDKGYQVVMKNLYNTQKGFAIVENMFWSAKDKSGKLDKIAEKILKV